MADSILEIKNAALSAIHERGAIASNSEVSRQNEETSRWLEIVVDTVQSAAHFVSSKVVATLPLERDQTVGYEGSRMSDLDFPYIYQWPQDCLHPWHFTDYSEFRVLFDDQLQRRVIYARTPQAKLIYARRNLLVPYWHPQEREAIIYGLAGRIAGVLTGKRSIISESFERANSAIENARSAASNMDNEHYDYVPQRFAHTGYRTIKATTKYIYPYGSMFS
jgi:hypothetical protein